MPSLLSKHVFILLFFMLCQSAAADTLRVRPLTWAQPVLGGTIDNFYQVSAVLYRAAQPDEKGMSELVSMGIKSVVNLRQYHSDRDEIDDLPLQEYSIPLNTSKVSLEEVVKVMQTLHDAPPPVLIHCWHGSDRTGVMVAFYRMLFQDWSKAEALDEFVNGGYGYHRLYKNLPALIENADLASLRFKLRFQSPLLPNR